MDAPNGEIRPLAKRGAVLLTGVAPTTAFFRGIALPLLAFGSSQSASEIRTRTITHQSTANLQQDFTGAAQDGRLGA